MTMYNQKYFIRSLNNLNFFNIIIMAFVSQAERDIGKIKNNIKIGPGSYNSQIPSEIIHSCAPFFSTTVRPQISINNYQPGPGQYTLETTIIHPAITTYTNNSSIIIKVNSAGTQPFLSKKQRFLDDKNGIPGPGQYILSSQTNQKTQKVPKSKSKKSKKLVSKKTAPSIFSKLLFLNEKQISLLQNQNDSASMLVFKNNTKGVLAGVWGKDRINRFGKRCFSEVGPGKYNIDARHKTEAVVNPAVGFSSKTVRSIFDTLIYNTRNNKILQFRLANNYRDGLPAPGSYDSNEQINMESLRYKNHTFGSTIPRFESNNINASQKAPYYDVIKNLKSQSFNKKKIPFNTETKRSSSTETKNQEIPGPGYYNGDKVYKTSLLTSSIQCFGSLVKRPFFQESSLQKIGPGYYQTQRSKTQGEKATCIFKSVIPRQFQKNNSIDKNFGEYDVFGEDISRRALQIKMNRNNLKLISCEVPPFSKKSPRFNHYQEDTKEKDKNLTMKQKLNIMCAIKEEVRQKQIDDSRQQINENKGCSIGRGQRFKNVPKCPGVGEYCLRSNWTKKSYNLKYKIQNTE